PLLGGRGCRSGRFAARPRSQYLRQGEGRSRRARLPLWLEDRRSARRRPRLRPHVRFSRSSRGASLALGARHSGFTPAASSTGPQIGACTAVHLPSSSGVPPIGTKPRLVRSARISGVATEAFSAALSLATIAGG